MTFVPQGEADDVVAASRAATIARLGLPSSVVIIRLRCGHRVIWLQRRPRDLGGRDIAAGTGAIDRLPLAHRFRAHFDGHALVEDGKRLGAPLRAGQTRSAIATGSPQRSVPPELSVLSGAASVGTDSTGIASTGAGSSASPVDGLVDRL